MVAILFPYPDDIKSPFVITLRLLIYSSTVSSYGVLHNYHSTHITLNSSLPEFLHNFLFHTSPKINILPNIKEAMNIYKYYRYKLSCEIRNTKITSFISSL